MKTQHTPGPWKIDATTKSWITGFNGSGDICKISDHYGHGDIRGTDLANAHLIAAAPDLLEACQTVIDGYETDGMENMQPRDELFYKYCKAAINKALNTQP